MLKYLRQQGIVEQFIRFADSKGVKRRNILIHKSYKLMERNLYGNIIYNILGREPYIGISTGRSYRTKGIGNSRGTAKHFPKLRKML